MNSCKHQLPQTHKRWGLHGLLPPPPPTPTCHLLLHPRLESLSSSCWSLLGASISQKLPPRPVTSAGSQKVWVSPVRIIPHIPYMFASGQGDHCGSDGGVESLRWTFSHYQIVPHHPCHHMATESSQIENNLCERQTKSRCLFAVGRETIRRKKPN